MTGISSRVPPAEPFTHQWLQFLAIGVRIDRILQPGFPIFSEYEYMLFAKHPK